MKIAVIGAGASGILAALQARVQGADVTLFEHNAEPGKKLLVTGSGRCNLTNEQVSPDKYHCADPAWMQSFLTHFSVPNLLALLANMTIPTQKTEDGWYYPLSNSAHSVVEALTNALNLSGVQLSNLSHVTAIRRSDDGFRISYIRDDQTHEVQFERVIVCAGGTAYPTMGARGELFPVLEQLGHTVLPPRPALAPVLADLGELKPLQGMRLNVSATLLSGSQSLAFTKGNLIFTEWGLNGPAVMDLSHHISLNEGNPLTLSLNLLAYVQDQFDQLLEQKRHSTLPLRVLLDAFFAPKVSLTCLKTARLNPETALHEVSDAELTRLTRQLQDMRLNVKGVRGFEYCQSSVGGVPVSEVDPLTLESRLVKGLYLAGETLDVVGPCGGYNLHFAFGSGALAGKAAAIKTID